MKLDIVSLEKAYTKRLALLHDFLYQEPVKGKKVSKREKVDTTVTTEKEEQMLISDTVVRSKRIKRDIVDELRYYGVQILEVQV